MTMHMNKHYNLYRSARPQGRQIDNSDSHKRRSIHVWRAIPGNDDHWVFQVCEGQIVLAAGSLVGWYGPEHAMQVATELEQLGSIDLSP